MDEHLLRDHKARERDAHKARERAAAEALAGKQHGSDDIEPAAQLAALNAKNRNVLEKTNHPVRQEIIQKQPIEKKKRNCCDKSEEIDKNQEIDNNLRQPEEEEDGLLIAEKKPLLEKNSKNLRQATEEEKDRPPNAENKLLKKLKNGDTDGKILQGGLETPTLESLVEQANAFAKSSTGTSMAAAADAFCRAAEHFAGGKDRKKRVSDTELNMAAMALFSVAGRAPSSEAGLATVAMNLTHGAQMVLLSDTGSKPGALASWWRWPRASSSSTSGTVTPKGPSLKQRLWAAISAREPLLPIYAEDEKQLVDKREVLYGLALAAPVAILTAAAGLNVFPCAWAPVAGASVGVWILAASGMVINQYSVSNLERLAARHLGRLGLLGAAVLFCFFTYRAFFPSASWAFWLLLVIAAIGLGLPWMLSCIRGDDVISASTESDGDAAGRAGKLEMRRGAPARRWTI